MSSNNNSNEGAVLAMGFALVGFAILAMAAFIFALAVFVSFIFTIFCLLAWNQPFTLGKLHITPEEARRFVGRGLLGMVLVPVFALFCALLFQFWIKPDFWPYLIVGGYALGSIGVEIALAQDQAVQVMPPQGAIPPTIDGVAERMPPHGPHGSSPNAPSGGASAQRPKEPPFRYASWDDDEELKG
ncbi:hypothetical protein QMO56_04310 [Roseomonas sp. E05]|uniref:hypothetical protein n=1 Tax=Roseomonas sp. E05 TaxID=3046310 RepID=UPI0024BBD277|nr:hypothetical protein [Roseomonas sp. E05]MDJ0387330.1 hypothetical protein [Roseomonas sp. E05]